MVSGKCSSIGIVSPAETSDLGEGGPEENSSAKLLQFLTFFSGLGAFFSASSFFSAVPLFSAGGSNFSDTFFSSQEEVPGEGSAEQGIIPPLEREEWDWVS